MTTTEPESIIEQMYDPGLDGPVLVLAGGLSAEREVSLRSAECVAAALVDAGRGVEILDAAPDVMGQLVGQSPPVVWPTLHGASGEDGSLAEVLRLLGVRVVGTGPDGCRLSWDKSVASVLAAGAGVQVPPAVTVSAELFRDLGAHRLVEALVDRLGLPVAVKPKRGGSGFGVHVVDDPGSVTDAVVSALGHDSACRVERAVRGREITVTVVELGEGARACPPVEVRPVSGEYDFSARYTAGAIEFHVPALVEPIVADRLRSEAVTVHRRLGLGALSRSDWILDDSGAPWFIEVNTSPGMTATSTAPMGLAQLGPLTSVLSALVSRARPLS
ncbi:MAG: D-alanine--D-alanine ligase [Kineosporiaceae bacterium]